MHVQKFLSRWLGERNVIGHKMRAESLAKAVESLIGCGRACLTAMGRSRAGDAKVKHQIQAMDRLLGNRHLHGELEGTYRALARRLLAGVRRPVIVVDWSDFESVGVREWAMLKAGVALCGRSFVLYSRVFPFRKYNSPGAHREFLEGLPRVLPKGCRPIVVTDAGFRGPWFRDVERLGWDWVGQIRNKMRYFNEATGRWALVDSLYKLATPTMKYLGVVRLSRRIGYQFSLYLVRAHAPLRPGRRRAAHNSPNVSLYRRLHKAPWLLATSLPHGRHSARVVRRLYASRMQIEESIRDTKSHRFGFGLGYARTHSAARGEVLLVIVALATLMLWMMGLAGRAQGLALQVQANTLKRHLVFSLPFLGRVLAQRGLVRVSGGLFSETLGALRTLVLTLEGA
jgi:hypothetical protein